MKRINSILLVSCIAVVAALVPQKAMAGSPATFENHIVKLTPTPAGAGKVYLVTDWNGKEWNEIASDSYSSTEIIEKATIETKDWKAIAHLYAIPNEGYKFAGFFVDEDSDDEFDITKDKPITFASDGAFDITCADKNTPRSYTSSPALQVSFTHESPNEYKGFTNAEDKETTEANKAAAEAARESDWEEFGCLNHFFAVFYKEGEENPVKIKAITVGSLKMSTFCGEETLDFSAAEKVKAYVASEYKDGYVTLKDVTTVPANTGIMLMGEAGTYEIPYGDGTLTETNLLKGVTADTELAKEVGANTNFILADDPVEKIEKNDKDEDVKVTEHHPGFYAVKNGTTLKAGKAYLPLPTADLPASSAIGFRFDGTTNISKPQADFTTGEWYSIDGRKLNEQPTERGLYIVNGKKVIIK